MEPMYYNNIVNNIRKELKSYIIENNIKSLVLGISGGMDSTLCAMLARPICDELNIPLFGRSLPIFSNKPEEIYRAKMVGTIFCTDFKEITGLDKSFNIVWNSSFKEKSINSTEEKNKIRKGNVKARVRMIYLYDLAQLHNGMVLSTDNYTEYLIGFFTLHGDVGDFGMIQNLSKTEVYNIAEWMAEFEYSKESENGTRNVIYSVINADATDGLGITNTDLDQILPGWQGSSREGYKKVDELLTTYVFSEYAYSEKKLKEKYKDCPVLSRALNTRFKRNNPFNIQRDKIIF